MRRSWVVPVATSSVLLLLFLWYKIARFQALYYTFNDMYIFLQSSCSWMDGRPVLYENIWGYDDRIHNNYEMLLWAPLIHTMGAYGAFLVQISLSILSVGVWLRFLSRQVAGWAVWVMLAVLFVGPIWFWLNDHPGIGWHPELTYLPLSLLFVRALYSGQMRWIGLAGLFIVLVKEDGALLAGALHLAWVGIRYLRAYPQKNVWALLQQRLCWQVLVLWATVFVAGMAFLSYKNHAAQPEPRLQQALHAIANGLHNRTFLRDNFLLLIQTCLLLAPSFGLLLYAFYRMKGQQMGSLLGIYGLAQAALLVSNWVQGSTYYGENPFFMLVSLTWPPRFVLVYAFAVCYVLTVWIEYRVAVVEIPRWKAIGLGTFLTVSQLPIAEQVRPDFRMARSIYTVIQYRYDPQKQPLLPALDMDVIYRLEQAIPAHSNVFVFDYLIPVFHKHYNIWPTEKEWVKADVAILPNDDFQGLGEHLPRIMKTKYRSFKLNRYTIFVTPAYAHYIEAILASKH